MLKITIFNINSPNILEQVLRDGILKINMSGTPDEISQIFEICANYKKITYLYLNNNYINPEEAQEIANCLKENRTIKYIDLSSNQIGATGAQAIAKALEHNQTLTGINLSSNQIGATGAQAIAKALEHNQTLTSFDLSSNGTGNDASVEISMALKNNKTITTAKFLCTNNIGAKRAEEIADNLEQNNVLTQIDDLFYNPITEDQEIYNKVSMRIESQIKNNQNLLLNGKNSLKTGQILSKEELQILEAHTKSNNQYKLSDLDLNRFISYQESYLKDILETLSVVSSKFSSKFLPIKDKFQISYGMEEVRNIEKNLQFGARLNGLAEDVLKIILGYFDAETYHNVLNINNYCKFYELKEENKSSKVLAIKNDESSSADSYDSDIQAEPQISLTEDTKLIGQPTELENNGFDI